MLEQNAMTIGLAGQYVDTYAFADGQLDVLWNGMSLPAQVCDKDQRVSHAAIVENKRLGEVLAFIRNQQELRSPPRLKNNSERIGYRKLGGNHRAGRASSTRCSSSGERRRLAPHRNSFR